MMKKLTALLLTFLFIIPMPKSLAAPFFSDNELAVYSEDIRFLNTFGVLDLENFEDQTKTITRGEFASVLISLHGLGDAAHSAANKAAFQDVPTDHAYAAQIHTAVQLGFLNGYSSDCFSPDENLLSEHAIVALVRSLGYGAVIDGSMQQYLAKAAEISLTKNVDVSIGFPISRYTLVQLLLNAIDIDFMEGFKEQSGTTYAVAAGKTIVSEVFCIERYQGTVTADKYTGLRTARGTGTSTALEIDGSRFVIPATDRSWVGFHVDYYVDKNAQDTIRYIKRSNKNTVTVLNATDCDITYNDGVYSYSDKDTGKKRTLKLASGFAVIYNGAVPESSADLTMAPVRGSVTLLDNGAGDGWNVVLIEDLTYCVAELVDTREMRIYAKRGTEIDLAETDFFEISDLSGRDLSIADIAPGNVILAAISQDGKVAKLDVSKQTISGEVKQINETDGEVSIDDKLYKLAPGLEQDEIWLGMKATFMLDRDGYIASFHSNQFDSQAGYLVAAAISKGLDEEIRFKIFDFSLGNYRVLSNKRKLTVDGTGMTPGEAYQYYTGLPKDESGNVEAFPVLYDESDTQGITRLVTPFGENQGEDALNLIAKNSNALYTSPQRGFYTSGIFPADSGIIYAVPSNPRDADATEYRRLSVSSFTHDQRYKIEAYRVGDDDSLYADIVLIDNKGGGLTKVFPGIVMDVARELLPDSGEIVTKVTVGMFGGTTDLMIFDEDSPLGIGIVPALSDGSPCKIATGDVIEFVRSEYHGVQKATDVSMVFSYEKYLQTGNGQLFGSNNIGANTLERRYIDGTIYKKDDNLMMITNAEIKGDDLPEQIPLETISTSRGNVYKLDKVASRQKVITASPNDIIPYSVSGANCSRLFYYAEWGWQQIFYIYE